MPLFSIFLCLLISCDKEGIGRRQSMIALLIFVVVVSQIASFNLFVELYFTDRLHFIQRF